MTPRDRQSQGVRLRVQGRRQVDPAAWDRALQELGGSFFHCHAQAIHESARPNASALFLEAFEGARRVGMASATVLQPRQPVISRYCREAHFGGLPATCDGTPEAERDVLAAFEAWLSRRGVFRFHVGGLASRHSARVLGQLGYTLSGRHEFYLRLPPDIEATWASLRGERRNKIRKARGHGLVAEPEATAEGLRALRSLNREALDRKGVELGSGGGEPSPGLLALLDNPARATLLICRREGVPLAGLIFGTFADHACTLVSGSTREGNRYGAPVLLRWRMIELLTGRGAAWVNLGGVAVPSGVDPQSDGLYTFKRDFGAEPVWQPSGVKEAPGVGRLLDSVRQRVKRLRHAAPGVS
jgi:hypothetical protein